MKERSRSKRKPKWRLQKQCTSAKPRNRLLAFAILFLAFLLTISTTAQTPYFSTTISQNGELMIGQTDWTGNAGGCTNQLLDQPYGIAIDAEHGKMYVADYANNRVLRFNYPLTGSKPVADLVFGQPDFSSNTINNGGLSASCLFQPISVAVDASGNLWVSDLGNKRILRYPNAWTTSSNKPNADVVNGTSSFTSSGAYGHPYQLTFDNAGNLWVADGGSHTVYCYGPENQYTDAPHNVRLGSNDFSANCTQNTFNYPVGVCMIGTSLFVADHENNRILRFDDAANLPDYANASACIGQPDYATNTSGTAQNKLYHPYMLTTDGKGNLYVADNVNHRVMIFNDAVNLPGYNAKASSVLGQPHFEVANALTTQNGLNGPTGIAFDPLYNKLLVSDKVNQRIVQYASQDNALAFDGVDDYVNLPAINLNSSNFTIQGWVRFDQLQSNAFPFIDFGNGEANNNIHIYCPANTNDVYFQVYNGATPQTITFSNAFTLGQYVHIAGVADNGTLKLYINGVLKSSAGGVIIPNINRTNCYLGKNNWSGTSMFKGQIDEVSIWNVALSEAEINAAMQVPLKGTETDLLAYYDFNTGNPSGTNTALTTLYDKTQTPYNGTLTNFALSGNTSNYVKTGASIQPEFVSAVTTQTELTINWTCGGAPDNYLLTVSTDPFLRSAISGYDKLDIGSETSYTVSGLSKGQTYYFNVWAVKDGTQSSSMGTQKATTKAYEVAGNALSFDGTDDYVALPGTWGGSSLSELTVEAWINTNNPETFQHILSSNAPEEFVHFQVGGNTLEVAVYADNGYFPITGTATLPQNEWVHVALVVKSGDSRLYINGVLDKTVTNTFSYINATSNLTIGKYINERFFNGSMDEIRIWNKARSGKEIRQTMDKTLAGNEPNLAGYWNFDEGEGTVVLDKTANENHGTYAAQRTASTVDVTTPGNALKFDGANDNVDMTTGYLDVPNNFTMEFWVNPTNTHEIDAEATSGYAGTEGQKYVIYPAEGATSNEAGVGVSVGTNGIGVYEHTGNYLPCLLSWTGTVSGWTHVAVVYQNKQPKLYVNGTLVKTGLTSPKTNVYPSVILGNHRYGGFAGEMDEFRVWNSSLSETEIQANMNQSLVGDESGLIAYYNFNETEGTTVNDLTANVNHGVIEIHGNRSTSSAPLRPADLQIPGIVTFDGVDDYISVANQGDDRLLAQSFSVAMWVKPAAEQVTNAFIIDANAGGANWGINQNGSNTNQYIFDTYENGGWNGTSGFSLPADEWSFLVVTRDGDSKQKKVYINGKLETTKTGTDDITFNNQFLQLGTRYGNYNWKGSMDEFGFYNKALSLNEIKALYMSHQQYDGNCQSIYIPFDEDAGFTCTDYSANNYPAVMVGNVERGAAATPVDTGMVVPGIFKASKGYYNTKVTLEWRVDNAWRNVINKWYIYRKEYGSADDSELIYSSGEGDNVVIYNDVNCDGGIIYEYRIVGETDFGGCLIYTNPIRQIGYRSPTAVITGQITFEGGSALENAKVFVNRAEGSVGKSAYFDGSDYAQVKHNTKIMPAGDSLTCEIFVKPESLDADATLLEKAGSYRLYYTAADQSLTFEVITQDGTMSVGTTGVLSTETFVQITGSYNGETISLYANGVRVAETTATGAIVETDTDLIFGENFVGWLDEIRLWNYGKDSLRINRDYFRILSGGEKGCIGYWRIDEAVGEWWFDQAHQGVTYFANDATFYGAEWADEIPGSEQLGNCGITDDKGNYQVVNIGYRGTGETFTVTPFYGIHKFDPSQKSLFMGDGAIVLNNQDFTDVSSFKVTGTVKYKDCDCYVKDVFLKIDGDVVVRNGQPITTRADGSFEMDVPIGLHSISLYHPDHVFENAQWPTDGSLHNFQGPVSGIEFIDTTLYTVVGRIVGGPREAAKKPGLGKSVNNIGIASLRFKSEQGNGCYTTEVTTDPKTGEYMVKLPPQRYIITDLLGGTAPVTNNPSIVFDAFDVLDISMSMPELTSEDSVVVLTYATITINHADETALVKMKGEPDKTIDAIVENGIALITVKGNDFSIELSEGESTTVEKVVDREVEHKSIGYHTERNFIYRSEMEIDVTTPSGDPFTGESTVYFYNEETKENEVFDLAAHPFAYPVYVSGMPYKTKISVFENYHNNDDNAPIVDDRVPVSDATLHINNQLSSEPEVEIRLNDGDTLYNFSAGNPNVLDDANNPEYSFTKTFGVKATTTGGATADWLPLETGDQIFRGYVFGSKFINGTDFVTNGPDIVTNIIHDPPGSGSSAFIAENATFSHSLGMSLNTSLSVSGGYNVSLGPEFTVGLGFMTDAKVKLDYEQNFKNTLSMGVNGSLNWSTTTSKKISTSGSPSNVGANSDIFIGTSTNFYFGVANRLQLIPASYMSDPKIKNTGVENNGFAIGVRRALLSAPGNDNTTFIYTASHIKNAIIPNLIALRDQLLQTSPDYELVFTDASDPRFGANNDDLVWGAARTPTNPTIVDAHPTDMNRNDYQGPSYIFKPGVAAVRPNVIDDKVRAYNQQIRIWEEALAANEREKLNAKFLENVSFSSGTSYSYQKSTSFGGSTSVNIENTFSMDMKTTLGGEVAGIGLSGYMGFGFSVSVGMSYGFSGNETNTYGYTLSDGDGGDYFTVDVLDPGNGHGPVFKTKGGRSKCPWEDAVRTEYYAPGTLLSYATIQREKPVIMVDKNVIFNVPETQEAEFVVTIGNESGSNEAMTYELVIGDASNPDGANISIDDNVFTIPGGGSITKLVKIGKGKADVYDYENLKLIVKSLCDNISDETEISVHFIPSCTGVDLKLPFDLFTVNNNYRDDEGNYKITSIIADYDLNRNDLKKIQLQYKPTNSSQWIGLQSWWKNQSDIPEGSPDLLLEGSELTYSWDVSQLIDGDYNLRAMSYCATSDNYSKPITGLFDRVDPHPFGSPQPADGVLLPGDEISVQFNEPIQAGMLTWGNFDVRGVLNGAQFDHNASLYFDGDEDNMRIPSGINLGGKPFTIEFWARRATDNQECFISQGTTQAQGLWIGFDAENKFSAMLAGHTITTAAAYPNDGVWHHYAFVYDNVSGFAALYLDGDKVKEENFMTDYQGNGIIYAGQSSFDEPMYYTGNMHELRIWYKQRLQTDLIANFYKVMTGNEVGLTACYPMNEAFGEYATDKVRYRNALVNAQWAVEPNGKAIALDGISQAVELPAELVAFNSDQNFTIEFWFKTETTQDACLFSNGKGEAAQPNGWSIQTTADGKIHVLNNGVVFDVGEVEYADGKWHHLALTVNRLGNTHVFIDGEIQNSIESAQFSYFGGPKIFVGARGFFDGDNPTTDMYFNGSIDEVRVWNGVRKSDHIRRFMNTRLTNEEVGLVAYYPFETYQEDAGVQILTESFADLSSKETTAVASPLSGATYTDAGPAIKLAQPYSKVNFTYSVNEDKIMFSLNDPPALLENCILDFAVKDVYDLNGNKMQSPAVWSGLVRMNQVRWQEVEKQLEKQLYVPKTISVVIENLGGSQQSFDIYNLPEWLTASPSSGVIDPLSEKEITLTISEGMNTGYYAHDIYLHSDFGFDEKLSLDLRVFDKEPEWEVNPADYQYSLNIIGLIQIDGVISNDVYDKVAAFVGDDCRGVANLRYIESLDMYEAFLDVYSNKPSGENITLQIWDASEGEVKTNVTPDYTFQENEFYGSPTQPEIFSATLEKLQSTLLNSGWNWVSVNVKSDDMTTNHIMAEVEPTPGDLIKTRTAYDQYDLLTNWVGTLGTLNNTEMYMVKLFKNDTLELSGSRLDPAIETIELAEGWNWIGYTPTNNLPVAMALSNFNAQTGDIVKGQQAFAIYTQGLGWIGTLNFMKPGQGYMLKSGEAASFVYPSYSFKSGTRNKQVPLTYRDWQVEPQKYQYTMSVIAEVVSEEKIVFLETDGIAAYFDDDCRAVAVPKMVEGRLLYFITVYSNKKSGDVLNFSYFNDFTHASVNSITPLPFAADKVTGTIGQPFEIRLQSNLLDVNSGLQDNDKVMLQTNPNPFNEQTDIILNVNGYKNLNVAIYDMLGKKVTTLFDAKQFNGSQRITWKSHNTNGSPVRRGVYFVKVRYGNVCKTAKLIKIR